MTAKKKFIIFITTFSIIIVGIIFLTSFWLRTTIKISPAPDKMTIGNHSTTNNPFKGYLSVGKYTLVVEKKGYPSLSEQIQVKAGKTNYSFTMLTYKERFIKSLPIDTSVWHIEYSAKNDLFYIQILSSPYQENLAKAKAFIASKGVDINQIQIYSWKPAQIE